jgi:hypothetical protein
MVKHRILVLALMISIVRGELRRELVQLRHHVVG